MSSFTNGNAFLCHMPLKTEVMHFSNGCKCKENKGEEIGFIRYSKFLDSCCFFSTATFFRLLNFQMVKHLGNVMKAFDLRLVNCST